ncbi:hypothetical protein [uncultured Roseobacter sp.]|uniref:hypothetical protein n=1 Tax=uncultured Roseobacter sp. TaxID=114847 RepID=UPI002638776F|nr:hypothetical protein [uncultured Roseobacter sp.]
MTWFRRLSALLSVVLLLSAGPALAADPVTLVGQSPGEIVLTEDAEERRQVDIPMLLQAEGASVVFAQTVFVKHDGKPAQRNAYGACIVAPIDNTGIWNLRLSTAAAEFAEGKHDLAVMIWTDGDPRPAQADCLGNFPAEATQATITNDDGTTLPAISGCASKSCKIYNFSVTVPKSAIRKGELLTLLGGAKRLMTFDEEGKPEAAVFEFVPGEGIEAGNIWLFDAAQSASDGRAEPDGFKACISLQDVDAGAVPKIILNSERTAYRSATYSVGLHAVFSAQTGRTCADPGTAPPRPTASKCKSAAETGTELTCQILELQVERKAAILDTPNEVVINITRVPILEIIPAKTSDNNINWVDSEPISDPLRVRETGFLGAMDLSTTRRAVRLKGAGGETDIASVTFGVANNPGDDLGILGPGRGMDLVPVSFELPTGYGSYSGTFTIDTVNATAPEREITIKVILGVPMWSLVILIVAGIIIGFVYRTYFESGLERDRELIQARHALDKLMRKQRAARDAEFIATVDTAIGQLRVAMRDVEATADSVKNAHVSALATLAAAEEGLSEAVQLASGELEAWQLALPSFPFEPIQITRAFTPAREHLRELRQFLNEEDVTQVRERAGLPKTPEIIKKALAETQAWVNLHSSELRDVIRLWATVRAESGDLGRYEDEIDLVEDALSKLATADIDPEKLHEVQVALKNFLSGYAVVLRHRLANELDPFVIALDDAARSAIEAAASANPPEAAPEMPHVAMMASLSALKQAAQSAEADWPVMSYVTHAKSLHRYVTEVARGLVVLGHLGDDKEPVAPGVALERAYGFWRAGNLAVIPTVLPQSDMQIAGELTSTGFRIVPPRVVYGGEAQMWRVEGLSQEVLPETVTWALASGPKDLAAGNCVYLTLEKPETVIATVDAAGATQKLEMRALPLKSEMPPDVSALNKRITKTVWARTLVNGILITIFGAVALEQVTAGYLACVVALVYGLAADVSANRLTDILARAPSK